LAAVGVVVVELLTVLAEMNALITDIKTTILLSQTRRMESYFSSAVEWKDDRCVNCKNIGY